MAKKIKTRSRNKVGVTPKKKLKWEPFEITRVKLNPEQAVLSCCDQGRNDVRSTFQCSFPAGCGTGSYATAS